MISRLEKELCCRFFAGAVGECVWEKKEGLFTYLSLLIKLDVSISSVHVQKVMIRVAQNPVYFFGLYLRRWGAASPRVSGRWIQFGVVS